jgi:hypothetical protein
MSVLHNMYTMQRLQNNWHIFEPIMYHNDGRLLLKSVLCFEKGEILWV